MENLAKTTGETLISLIKNKCISETSELENTMKSTEQRLKELRAEGATKRFDIEKLTRVFSFYHSMKCLAEDIIYANRKN